MPFTQSKVILFSRKGGGELRIFHCNFLGYVRCHNFALEQLCVKPSRLIKILTFIQGGRERRSSMKWNEALLKSYSSLQHDPDSFQNNPSDMTKQYYLLLVVPITLMKKTGFSPLTYFSFLQGKRKKMHWNCTRLCYSSSLLADLWWKMSQLVFGYSNMYSNSYLTWLSIFCLQIHMQLKGKGKTLQ